MGELIAPPRRTAPLAPWLASLIDPSSCLGASAFPLVPELPSDACCKVVMAMARGGADACGDCARV